MKRFTTAVPPLILPHSRPDRQIATFPFAEARPLRLRSRPLPAKLHPDPSSARLDRRSQNNRVKRLFTPIEEIVREVKPMDIDEVVLVGGLCDSLSRLDERYNPRGGLEIMRTRPSELTNFCADKGELSNEKSKPSYISDDAPPWGSQVAWRVLVPQCIPDVLTNLAGRGQIVSESPRNVIKLSSVTPFRFQFNACHDADSCADFVSVSND
jgi:hypothetical protein